MPSLNLDPHYFTHPKTRRLVALLGPGAEVLPLKLWCYAALHHPEDGRFPGYSVAELEAIMEWEGTPGNAVDVLRTVGFLDRTRGKTFLVHDWKLHAGHIAVYRDRAQASALKRWDKARKQTEEMLATSNATSMREACVKQSQGNAMHGRAMHTPLPPTGGTGADVGVPAGTGNPRNGNGTASKGRHWWDPDAPDWIARIGRQLADERNLVVPEELQDAFFRWRNGEDVTEPTGMGR